MGYNFPGICGQDGSESEKDVGISCQPPMSTKVGTEWAWGRDSRASDKSATGRRACVCFPSEILPSHLLHVLWGSSNHYLSALVGQEGEEGWVEWRWDLGVGWQAEPCMN